MARTVSQAFQEFMKRYEPSPWQKDLISRHHNHIRNVLSNKVDIVEDFLTGSYIKQTQIRPPTDIDLFIVINSSYYYNKGLNTAKKTLYWFWNLLKETYPTSPLKPDGQAVVVKFSDGIKMDIVPAFQKKGGGYLIPNANTNSFIPTDPKKYNELLSNANLALDEKLKPLIKMIKCWNVIRENFLRSLHIEVLSLSCFCDFTQRTCYPFESYQDGLQIFFDKARNLIKMDAYEPITKDRIDIYLDSYVTINSQRYQKRDILAHLFQKHYNKILYAIHYQEDNNHKKAIEIWKEIFGEYFPSYY